MKNLIGIIIGCALAQNLYAAEVLRIHGSNTVGAQLMPAMVKAWLHESGFQIQKEVSTSNNERTILAVKGRQHRSIEIHAHGSSTGFHSIAERKADLAMSSRPVKDKELTRLKHLGDLSQVNQETVVGLDGIAVVVHPDNPVSALSMRQLRGIFSGAISNWMTLGGSNQPIRVYARDNRSGTYDTFKSLVLSKQSPLLSSAIRYESNHQLSDDVAADSGGIGFVGLPSIRQAKALAIADGQNRAILPSELSVATEDYPLSRRLYVYTPQLATPLAAELAQYIKSAQGQGVVANSGFISQNVNAYEVTMNPQYPSEYQQLVSDANRLSLNFRFNPKQYKLDNKALQDIERLLAYLKKSAAKQVILAGFSDGAEAAPWRRYVLSIERGDFVAEALIKNGISPKAVRGFGSEVQVASNTTTKGRDKNRRVEVWVR